MAMSEVQTFQTRLEVEEAEAFKAQAARLDRSVAYCMRIAIREWVANQETNKETAQ